MYSNPVSLRQSGNVTFLLFQSTNGQVFANRILPGPQFGKWVQVGGNLPYDEGAVYLFFFISTCINLLFSGIFAARDRMCQ